MLIPLHKGILYGPVESRRLGKSLGVNLLPENYKLCSFNCVYCHFGWTGEHKMDPGDCLNDFPSIDKVITHVEDAFKSSMEFDFLTLSGNGEPTLYPWFAELVDKLVEIRNRFGSEVKITLLSNSTGLLNHEVRNSISKLDFPFLKLDAGTAETFRDINDPVGGVDFATILDQIASLKNIFIQTMLVEGSRSNVTEKDLSAYFRQINRIRPKEVHIYSIDRPVPEKSISLVGPDRLKEIALQGQKKTGVPFKAFLL